jgi:hypothetical protein
MIVFNNIMFSKIISLASVAIGSAIAGYSPSSY